MSKFEINAELFFSFELNISDKSLEKILEICKSLDTQTCISGIVWIKNNLEK